MDPYLVLVIGLSIGMYCCCSFDAGGLRDDGSLHNDLDFPRRVTNTIMSRSLYIFWLQFIVRRSLLGLSSLSSNHLRILSSLSESHDRKQVSRRIISSINEA
jgi:hypothetical protein